MDIERRETNRSWNAMSPRKAVDIIS